MLPMRALDIVRETHINNFGLNPSQFSGSHIGYNFTIDKDSNIKQWRKVGEETMAQKGYNFDTISICMLMDGDKEMPTANMIIGIKQLIKDLRKTYGNIPVKPHRWFTGNGSLCQFKNDKPKQSGCPHKSCCGLLMSDKWIDDTFNLNLSEVKVPEPTLTKIVYKACQSGDTGANVKLLQERLVKENCLDKSFVTQIYDKRTCDAVLCFQNKYNISNIVDRYFLKGNFVGPKTLAILNK